MHAWLRDLRYASRTLRRRPGFLTAAVLSLALGIGANVAGFSLINGLLLRELPVREPGQLLNLSQLAANGHKTVFSFPMFRELERSQRAFSAVLGWTPAGRRNVETPHGLERAEILAVSGDFFPALGIAPAMGRTIAPADAGSSPALVAVVGHRFWQRAFAGDPTVIGRTVRLETTTFTVIGVAPAGFKGLGIVTEPDFTIPLTAIPIAFDAAKGFLDRPDVFWVSVTARLASGVTMTQAQAAVDALWPRVLTAVQVAPQPAARPAAPPPGGTAATSGAATSGGATSGAGRSGTPRQGAPPQGDAQAGAGTSRTPLAATRVVATSGARGSEGYLRAQFTRPLVAVLGVAALTLLIAGVNLATLLLARAADRASEIGVRLALGGSRWQLVRQAFAEGALLALIGSAAGFIVGCWASALLQPLILQSVGGGDLDVAPDWRVYGFIAVVALALAVLVSAAPAWLVTRHDLTGMLQRGSRTVARSGRASRVLMVTQLALSLVLLMHTGLLVRTLVTLRATDPGYTRAGVIAASLAPQPGGYQALQADLYYPAMVARVAALPGVRAASLTKFAPASGAERAQAVVAASQRDDTPGLLSTSAEVSPGFFETVGIRLLRGRDLAWRDDSRAPKVGVISASLARRLFPTTDGVGKRIRVGGAPDQPPIEVVGVVSDARLYNPRDSNPFAVYVPLLQVDAARWSDLIVRADGPANALSAQVRHAVRALGREDIVDTRHLAQVFDRTILKERVTALLAGFFGVFALLLAAVGLSAVMSYLVAQRRRELGIRAALGATRAAVLRHLLGETLVLILLGLAFGIPAALASSRLVARLLPDLLVGVQAGDLPTLLAVGAILLLVGVLAGGLPARRAARTPPSESLRA